MNKSDYATYVIIIFNEWELTIMHAIKPILFIHVRLVSDYPVKIMDN